jgi:hypothetical protein
MPRFLPESLEKVKRDAELVPEYNTLASVGISLTIHLWFVPTEDERQCALKHIDPLVKAMEELYAYLD